MGPTITITRIAIWLDKPNSQSLNYTIKTRPMVLNRVCNLHSGSVPVTSQLIVYSVYVVVTLAHSGAVEGK